MPTVTPFLWFSGRADEAIELYTSIFRNSKVKTVNKMQGQLFAATVDIEGQTLMFLNAGPAPKFSEACSLFVQVDTQAEIDEYWSKLTADGGEESQCGWLKDKFGVSWQIIPKSLSALLSNPDPSKAGRVMQAMLQMQRIDIAALERARDGA